MRAQDCAFCNRGHLSNILMESERFLLLADHAPLVAGHLLIIPREHYACYGAVPADLEDELLALKARVADFLAAAYHVPIFFEHGVFRQTVYHAHLHAIPLGAESFRLDDLLTDGARRVHTPADIRAWYAERGHYYYIEHLARDGSSPEAVIFPPAYEPYFSALGRLRNASGQLGAWEPQPLRRLHSQSKIDALKRAWEEYARRAGG
ncbi:MAG: hypothetical protein OJF49_004238 [Ktedonobacterales bacterium]|jgi:diadenosine tetraphosphate (Ap4A) HIT family hydrolase|nr:MAG: hypothetical protein OJF49_004238 [Ktedonobacterales bacterium]